MSNLLRLSRILRSGVHVQPQTLRVQIHLVLAAVLLQDRCDVSGVLDLPQFDVALALLDRVSDQFRRSGLTLGADDECLLLLAGLVDQERSPLGLLLSDLLGFDSGGEFGGEGQMLPLPTSQYITNSAQFRMYHVP